MGENTLSAELLEGLQATTMLDAHTHLTGGRMSARGLHDIVLYHMVVSDLYSAGCPSGARLTEYPGWPTKEEAHARLREAMPYLSKIQNTSCFWGVRIILRDLYGWNEPITADNWERLDAMVRQRADDRAWQREIIRRANINRLTTELQRRCEGQDDDILQYSMEWAFFTRTQRGEFDTAVYELERCWDEPPGSPIPHGATQSPGLEAGDSQRGRRSCGHGPLRQAVGRRHGALAWPRTFPRTSSFALFPTPRWRRPWPAATRPARTSATSTPPTSTRHSSPPWSRYADQVRLPVQHCGGADAARDGQHLAAAGDQPIWPT